MPCIHKKNIEHDFSGFLLSGRPGFFIFKKVFSETSDSVGSQGYQLEGRKTISPRNGGGRNDETQLENQCFKTAADRWDRILQECHGQGKVHEDSLW